MTIDMEALIEGRSSVVKPLDDASRGIVELSTLERDFRDHLQPYVTGSGDKKLFEELKSLKDAMRRVSSSLRTNHFEVAVSRYNVPDFLDYADLTDKMRDRIIFALKKARERQQKTGALAEFMPYLKRSFSDIYGMKAVGGWRDGSEQCNAAGSPFIEFAFQFLQHTGCRYTRNTIQAALYNADKSARPTRGKRRAAQTSRRARLAEVHNG